MEPIYHITTQTQADEAKKVGHYSCESLETEGFVHCSYSRQFLDVANTLFFGQQGLVVLEIDPELVNCEIRRENTVGGSELFPHVYGVVPSSSITRVHKLRADADGKFSMPSSFLSR